MVLGRDDLIVGIGGSGKTTLVEEWIKDDHVRCNSSLISLFLSLQFMEPINQLVMSCLRAADGITVSGYR